MARHAPAAPPLSAPDLIGPTSILDWPTSRSPTRRSRAPRSFAHVRVEIDLQPEIVRELGLPGLRQVEALLREREVVERGDLLRLTARMLHALSARGFGRVDHWEVAPGGWLPLPEPAHAALEEPVGHFLRALESDAWKKLANARSFAVRLSGSPSYRVDATVRRVHRERVASLTLELRGRISREDVPAVVSALGTRLPILGSRVREYTPG